MLRQRILSKAKFKKLQKKYYKKIKDKFGFDDIEDTDHIDRPLKKWTASSLLLTSYGNHISRAAIEEYYSKADGLLHSYNFESEKHKHIWQLHCKGKTNEEIAEIISKNKLYKGKKTHKSKPHNRHGIGAIIRKIVKASGLKT
jgi:hypothetical protein